MDKNSKKEVQVLVAQAASGDKEALEVLIADVQDMIFNLSLRMLGTFADAEDATQDILLKIITHLSSFRGESSLTTWVFRIAVNYLKNYKKHMFAQHPLSFEYYGDDIENGSIQDVPDFTQDVEKSILVEELKLSCTNVMLQCLDTESRCIFVLGTMFKVDSRIAAEILDITPEAYRQRLVRIRRKMADFLERYCGAYGRGKCKCQDRVNYAVQNHRINPLQLEYTTAMEISVQTILDVKHAMEEIDDLSQDFSFCKGYQSSQRMEHLIRKLLDSEQFSIIRNA